MQVPETLKKQGVQPDVFKKLLSLGWVDSSGRSLTWDHWNRVGARSRSFDR